MRLRESVITFGALFLLSIPAYAQGLAVDTGTSTIVGAILQLIGLVVLVVCAFKGVNAVMHHESFMGSAVGVVLGLGLVFGPYWYVQKMGVGGGIALGAVGL